METWVEENTDSNKYINYKFTGKELDEETGLYYFGARYYDSKTSVFMSADPIYDGVKEGFGVYTYCRNNPLKYTDPTGLNARYEIDDKSQTINIVVDIVIYGNDATNDIAKTYQDGINNTWSGDFKTKIGDAEYSVKISSNVTVGEKPNETSENDSTNYIKVDKKNKRSFVKGNGFEGTWRANGRNEKSLSEDNPAAHETGHLLGLDDRYSDVTENGKTISKPDKDWENNLMGGGSSIDQRNIDGVMKSITNPESKKQGVIVASPMEN